MLVFEVLKSLETQKLNGSTVKDLLSEEKVLLLVDDDQKVIHIYRGNQSGILLYLIAQRLAKEARKVVPGYYTINDPMDATTLQEIQGSPVSDVGKLPEFYNPAAHSKEEAKNLSKTKEKAPIKQDSAWVEKLKLKDFPVFKNINSKISLQNLKEVSPVPGYRTEMVLVNNTMYSPQARLQKFLDGKKVEEEFVELGNLPEGWFFRPEYTPRFTTKAGVIRSVEFLRNLEESTNANEFGSLNIPLIEFSRMQQENSMNLLTQAFKIPKVEPLDNLIQKLGFTRRS